MAGIRVSPNVAFRSDDGRFLSHINNGIDMTLDELTKNLEAAGKAEAPVDRGVLKGRTKGYRVGNQAFCGSNIYYAEHVIDGTVPHPISRRDGSGGAMSNKRTGWHGRGSVPHPGTKPNNYLLRAYHTVAPTAMDTLDANI